MIKKYKLIPKTVEAVQLTEDTIQDVIDLTGPYYFSGLIRADFGEWIVKHEDGKFDIVTDEEFQLSYRQT